MPSFQISITPSKRVAARFIGGVRRKVLRALEEENDKRGLKQTDIARAIGVYRSVINRELRGMKDITLGRLAELAWALGRTPFFDLIEPAVRAGSNLPPNVAIASVKSSQDGVVALTSGTTIRTSTSATVS
jgi:Helix-turn-helix